MYNNRVRIVRAGRHRILSPRGAAVFACHHAHQTVGDDDAIRPVRVHENTMDVAFLRIRIDGELNETLAGIVGHLKRTDLYAYKKALAIDHDVLDVSDARRWWKGPLRHALCFTECLEFAPRRTFVLADI